MNLNVAERRLKLREILETVGISHGSVVLFLNDHLAMMGVAFLHN